MTLRILEVSIYALASVAVGLTIFDCFVTADCLTTVAAIL